MKKKAPLLIVTLSIFLSFDALGQCTITRTISGPSSVCPESVGNVFTTEAGMTNYNWSVSGGIITDGGTSSDNWITITANALNSVFINLAYTDNTGCRSGTTKSIAIDNQNPSISGDLVACKGSTGNIYTTESGMSNYLWMIPASAVVTAGGTSTDNSVTITWSGPYNPIGPEQLAVGYTNTNGCAVTSFPAFGSVLVTEAIVPIFGSEIVCEGSENYFYTDQFQSSYIWTVSAGGTITSGGSSSDHFVYVKWDSLGSHFVTASYTTGTGCAPSSPTVKNVTVNPSVNYSIDGNSNGCINAQQTFTTQAGHSGYGWNAPGATIIGGSSSNTITLSWNTSGIKNVSVSIFNGTCWGPSTTKTVTINTLPIPSFTGSDDVCQGSAGEIYGTEPGKTNYVWNILSPFSDGTLISGGTSSDNTATVSWNSPGSNFANVSYTDENGCIGTTSKMINVVPAISRLISGNTSVCIGTPQIYTTDEYKEDYDWTVTGGAITTGDNTNSVTVIWNETGNQTLSVYYSDPTTCRLVTPTSKNITVNNSPFPSIIGNASGCLGNFGNEYSTETGKFNYIWTVTEGVILNGQGTSSIRIHWNTPGNQTVSVSYNDGCPSSGSATKNVTISSEPTIAGDTITPFNEQELYITEPGMSNYIWTISSDATISAGGTSTDNTISVQWQTLGDKQIAVNYTTPDGCALLKQINITVVKGEQTIIFNPLPPMLYNDSDLFPLTATGGLSGNQITYSSSNPNVAIVVNKTVIITGIGTTNITASQGGDNNFNPAPDVVQPLTVDKGILTVTANNADRIYGEPNPPFSVTYDGFRDGENVSVLTALPTISSPASTVTPAGTAAIIPNGGSADNYNFSYVNGTLTIGKATLTVTANDASRPYGDPNPTFPLTYAGFKNGETSSTLTTLPTATSLANAASPLGTYSIIPAGGAATNYNFNYVNGALTVNKATLTVMANNANRLYGDPNPTFSVAYSGFKNGETSSVLTSLPSATSVAHTSSPPGIYDIMPTGGTATNYDFSYINGILTIGKAILIVTANDTSRLYGDPNPTFSVTYSGFINGETASVLTTLSSASSAANETTSAGTAPIVPLGGSADNYNFSYVNGTLTIDKATLTVTANDAIRSYGDPNPTFPLTYAGFKNGETSSALTTLPTATSLANAASPLGTYSIIPTGGAAPNYNFNYVNGALTVNKATLTVMANNAIRSYGDPNPTFPLTYAGFKNGETSSVLTSLPTTTSVAHASSPPGIYDIMPTGGIATNYNFSYVNGALTIGKATLMVTANDTSRLYGDPNPTFSLTYTGFKNGETAFVLTAQPTATSLANTSSPAGEYGIIPMGGSSDNYNFSYANAVLTIKKASLTVKADNQSKVYLDPNPFLTITYSGFKGTDDVGSIDSPPGIFTNATQASSIGTYPITLTEGADNNYTLILIGGTLRVETLPANFVTIPDPNFRAALKNRFPSCFNSSEQMDINCSPIVNPGLERWLDVSNKNIQNLSGIEYFTQFVSLNCSNNQLTSLPQLPDNFQYLYCSYNQLTSLPVLPSGLIQLVCSNNQLASIPALPNSLGSLDCFNNQLTSLPSLSENLTYLNCWDNQLTSLPILPSGLKDLRCYNNELTSLPILPSGLKDLRCYNNELTSLPALPNSLTYLYCNDNQLTSLPVLPSSLIQLVCASNQLASIPALPNSLGSLNCFNNQLTSLPSLPNVLTSLNCTNNQLNSLPALPVNLISLNCSVNLLVSLPTLPSSLTSLICASNQLTFLPTLPINLTELYCRYNQLDFLDFETIDPKPSSFNGTSQSYTITPSSQTLVSGSTLVIDGTIGGSDNQYQWYKNGNIIVGETSATFIKTNITSEDASQYRCMVTSNVSGNDGITITSQSVHIMVKLEQTIAFTSLPVKTLGDAPFALTASASSLLPISYISSNTDVATISGNTVTIVGAGTTNITASQLGNANYNSATDVTQALTVNKVDQTITFNVLPEKTYSNTPFNLIATGGASGNPVTFISSNTAVATISGNTVTIVGAGSANITASQAGNANYNAATSVTRALTVNKANQTITFNTLPAKTYGNPPFTLAATGGASGNPITYTSSNTAVATISGSTVTIIGAGSANITASQAGNANYNTAPSVTRTLTVNKANQTITFNTLPVKTYGNTPFSLTATGGASGNSVTFTSSNTAVATISGNTVTIVGAGSANITASQAGNANYNTAPSVTRTLTVNKANQTITFNTLPTKTYGNAPFTLTATGGASGNPVTFVSSNTAVATISGNTVTIVGAGSANITASLAGDANYNAAANVVRALTVNKASQTITFNTLSPKSVGDAFTVSATSSSGLSITFTSTNTSVATVSGNIVTAVATGTTNIRASQPGNANYNAATDVLQSLTINPFTVQITGNTSYCQGGYTVLSSQYVYADQSSFLWSNGITTSINVVQTPGNYSLTVTKIASGISATSNTLQITEIQNTNGGSISVLPGYCLSQGSTYTLTANPVGTQYIWSTGETTRSISVQEPGNYTVSVTNGGTMSTACKDIFFCYVRSRTPDIEDTMQTEENTATLFQYYPNPADREMTIELPETATQPTPIQVFDQMGKVVHQSTLQKGDSRKTIGTDELAGGVYLIQIESQKGILRRKVMVLHRN